MTDLNRRHLLAGAATFGAAAVTGFGPTVANASVPQAGTQAPGFYRYKVGSYECTSINDGARTFPMPDKFVVNAPKEVLSSVASDRRTAASGSHSEISGQFCPSISGV